MFSLLQVILSLNVSQGPTVNVITHFNSLEVCEIKLEQTLKRNIDGGNNAKLLLDNDKNKYIKIEFNNDDSVSYWFCKETIFNK